MLGIFFIDWDRCKNAERQRSSRIASTSFRGECFYIHPTPQKDTCRVRSSHKRNS